MDKLSRLQALTGDEDIVEQESSFEDFMFTAAKPAHVYEGTDSEDDEIVTSRKATTKDDFGGLRLEDYIGYIGTGSILSHAGIVDPGPVNVEPADYPKDFFNEYHQLELGELTVEGERFSPLVAIKKYPYTFVGVGSRQKVAEGFFDQGKLLNNNTWDIFYIHRSTSDFQNQPILLVPTKEFECFLSAINRKLNTRLAIPSGGESSGFIFTFIQDGTPQPRYLGRSTSSEMEGNLKMNVPPNSYRIRDEPDDIKPDDRSLAGFRKKIDLMLQAQKGKKAVNKEKQKVDRIAKQQSWSNSIKRVQRYLGLRETRYSYHASIKAGLDATGLNFSDSDAAAKAAASQLPPTTYDATNLAPFVLERDVIFVSIDVEAYERDARKITEIGIATLDTRDIAGLVPGVGGADWFRVIRSRHFRINEYRHLKNHEFVEGCADRFESGDSEFINLKDAPRVVASCFKPPFSKSGEAVPTVEELPKRNIILVGHDVGADVNFLRSIGYDVYNLSNLMEQVDTASMWRYCTRDSNPRNLGSILAELGILGWNLHNAGNDATYTLQAMIAISIKHIVDKQKARGIKEAEKVKRISETVAEAAANAIEREQGWSSGGDSDGGEPVALSTPSLPKGAKKVNCSQPWGQSNSSAGKNASRYTEHSWKTEKRPQRWAGDGDFDKWSGGHTTTTPSAAVQSQSWGNFAAQSTSRVQGSDATLAAANQWCAPIERASNAPTSAAAPPIGGQWGKIENSMNNMEISERTGAVPANISGRGTNQGPSNISSASTNGGWGTGKLRSN